MEEKNKKKKIKIPWVEMMIGAVFGGAAAFLCLNSIPDKNQVMYGGLILCGLVLWVFLHTIIHEGGHLIAGLLSGYKFVSFRISSMMWMKKDGRIQRKKFSVPGTGGQCLLRAPGGPEDEYPCILYNLGGGLANIITAFIAVVVCVIDDHLMTRILLIPFALAGIYLAAVNLIPLKISGIANDGMNIKEVKSDKQARKGLWLQLEVNKLQTDGLRLRDMPEEYFHLDNEEDIENPLICAIVLMRAQRFIDQRRFDAGRQLLEEIHLSTKKIMDLYRWEARCDLLFLELTGECQQSVIEKIMTPGLKKYMKMTKAYPSRQRTLFAYHKLYTLDEKSAEKAEVHFAKAAKTYPMEGEIQGEAELMELIRERGTKDESLLLQ